jgi:hypothetical protein
MTDDTHRNPAGHSDPAGSGTLDLATSALREYTRDRWVEVSDRILATALTATRRARPVRATAPGGTVQVSEQVIVTYLRAAVDVAVPGVAVHRIDVTLVNEDTFETVIVQIAVQYGLEVLPAAHRIRGIATRVLHELLGPEAGPVTVRVTHVHVSDVTRGDPATTDSGLDN